MRSTHHPRCALPLSVSLSLLLAATARGQAPPAPQAPLAPQAPPAPQAPLAPQAPQAAPPTGASASQPATTGAPLRLAVSAHVNGQLLPLACRDGEDPPTFLRLAGRLAAEPGTIAIDAGDLLGAAALTRLAVEADASGLADALAGTGLVALAVGHRDLAARRDVLVTASRALAARGVPHVLTNLRCEPAARALCQAIVDADDPPLVVDTAAGRVALVAGIAPAALETIARDRAEGLTLLPPTEALPAAVAAARRAGAAHVVVTLDPTWHEELADALALAAAFAPGEGPDVLLVHDLPAEVATLATRTSGVPIVATRSGEVIVVEPGAEPLVRPARDGAAPPPIARWVSGTAARVCERYREPLPAGTLAGPLDRDAFAALLLDVLREEARAEVAVMNRGAVRDPRLFPLSGAITTLDVLAALPFDDTIEVTRVKGAALKALATSPRAPSLYLRGLTVDVDRIRVNGRPLDEAGTYRIVTTGYLAAGGDGGLGVKGPRFRRHGGHTLQEALLAWLGEPRGDDVTRATTDPGRHTRWVLRFGADAGASATTVRNGDPAVYDDTQLVRAESSAARIDAEARADADHPAYTWENGLRVRYGIGRTIATGGTDTGFVENLDLVTERTTFTFRAVREGRRFYHPLPFFESFTESEFGPEPSDRTYHHLQTRPTVGLRFELAERMTLSAGAGLSWEVLDPSGGPAPVVVAGWALRPGQLWLIDGRKIEGQGALELTWRDPGDPAEEALVRVNAKISVPLLSFVSVVLGYDLFARQVGDRAWAVAGDGLIGLKVAYDLAVQSFAY